MYIRGGLIARSNIGKLVPGGAFTGKPGLWMGMVGLALSGIPVHPQLSMQFSELVLPSLSHLYHERVLPPRKGNCRREWFASLAFVHAGFLQAFSAWNQFWLLVFMTACLELSKRILVIVATAPPFDSPFSPSLPSLLLSLTSVLHFL